jgi:hypothetical protein
MAIIHITQQIRATVIASSMRFYREKIGFSVEFNDEGLYVGLRSGDHVIQLKHPLRGVGRRVRRIDHATGSSKRPVASRSRSYRRMSGNGGSQDSRRMVQSS